MEGDGVAVVVEEREFLSCCGSTSFAKQMTSSSPFYSLHHAVSTATDIWFNNVDVSGWLEAFTAHPQIGHSPDHSNPTFALWSKREQSTALATATNSTLQELSDWNSRYKQKFGFVFLIFASGRSTPEILAELKRRYENRPLIEFENAAKEQMKITELRLSKLFSNKTESALKSNSRELTDVSAKAEEDRMNIIGAHLTGPSEASATKPAHIPKRTRPPITIHVLDLTCGSPANGVEVKLEMNRHHFPSFGDTELGNWVTLGSSVTDKDGRSGQLMSMTEELNPGTYRISFNTGKYFTAGFYPYVSIVFEVKESQKWEHFHVPLLLSPFSFSTYRGS